jgi:hypothetical protein
MDIIYRMRLIRLTTETNDGRFDCDFNEDLVIPPNSQIALHSFTTQFPSATIVINTLNNELRYGVDDSGSKRIILPQGTYSNANIQEFFGQTQQLLNESLAYTQNQVGKQWRAGIFGGKTQFTIKQGIWNTSSTVLTDNNSKNVAFVGTLDPTVILRYQRLGGLMTSNDAFLYFTTPIVKSSGFFTQRVLVDSTTQTNGGFILGLTSNCPNSSTTAVNPQSLEYGIRFNGVGLPYSEISDGITTETTVLGVLGDTLQLNYGLKKMTYTIKRFAGGEVILKEAIFNHLSDYFPVSILNGDCILGETWYIKDPKDTSRGGVIRFGNVCCQTKGYTGAGSGMNAFDRSYNIILESANKIVDTHGKYCTLNLKKKSGKPEIRFKRLVLGKTNTIKDEF